MNSIIVLIYVLKNIFTTQKKNYRKKYKKMKNEKKHYIFIILLSY